MLSKCLQRKLKSAQSGDEEIDVGNYSNEYESLNCDFRGENFYDNSWCYDEMKSEQWGGHVAMREIEYHKYKEKDSCM